MLQVTMLGIDLGKNSCSLVGLDATGKVVVRRRMRRETVIAFCLKLPTCTIAMEACCGAHHMGRALAAQGHVIRLMSPEYVPTGSGFPCSAFEKVIEKTKLRKMGRRCAEF